MLDFGMSWSREGDGFNFQNSNANEMVNLSTIANFVLAEDQIYLTFKI